MASFAPPLPPADAFVSDGNSTLSIAPPSGRVRHWDTDGSDVVVDSAIGPMPPQHSAAPLINFCLPQDGHTCSFESKVQSSYG